jgi:purine-binding chemotaxis protein CheW
LSRVQFTTFVVDDRLYGVRVELVQEVTKAMPLTKVPLSASYVHGLINLRGQIATAVGLKELFSLEVSQASDRERMNVVCKAEGVLLALVVDEIGDVVEVSQDDFEPTPETVCSDVGRFMAGVFKTPGRLLSVIDIEKIVHFLNKK